MLNKQTKKSIYLKSKNNQQGEYFCKKKEKKCQFYVYFSRESWHFNVHSEEISTMSQNFAVKSQTFLIKFFQDQTIYIHITLLLLFVKYILICVHFYSPKEHKHQRGSKVSIKMNLVLWDYKGLPGLFVWAHDRTLFHLLDAKHTFPWLWMLL